jgi:MinD superfamily P-loop ATPase
MKIAILSGKGGTGKTTLSVNLFSLLKDVALIDTDIEEPNSHLFIQGDKPKLTQINKGYPIVDDTLCTRCGKCGDYCNFNAIIPTKKRVIVSSDLCHDCGLCAWGCPEGAIHYEQKSIGDIYQMSKADKTFSYGLLNTGEVSGVRIIEALKKINTAHSTTLIDCPPGVACNTSVSIEGVDYAILVTEPTPFGLSDMKMVVTLLRNTQTPFGVVINKAGLGNNDIYTYLKDEAIPLLGELAFSDKRASLSASGKLLVEHDQSFKEELEVIINHLKKEVSHA